MMMNFKCLAVVVLLAASGCASSGWEDYYVPASESVTYPPVKKVELVEVRARDPEAVHRAKYPLAQVVGESSFSSGSADKGALRKFAGTVGADLVILHRVPIGRDSQTSYAAVPDTTVHRFNDGTTGTSSGTTYRPMTSSWTVYGWSALLLRREQVPPSTTK